MRAALAPASGSSQQPHGHGARNAGAAAPGTPRSAARPGFPACSVGVASCALAPQGSAGVGAPAPARQGVDPVHTQATTKRTPTFRAQRHIRGTLHEPE